MAKFDTSAQIIVLDVELEQGMIKTTKTLALDTGATFVMLPWEVAELLGLRPELSQEKTDIITANGVIKAPVVAIDSIRVLGAEAKGVKVVIHDLPERSYVDGLLGLSFLRNFDLSIRFREGVLEIT